MKNTNDFKDAMHQGMIKNFERDGHLAPVLFLYKEGNPTIGEIPNELLSTPEGKDVLSGIIHNICLDPDVLAVGVIMEAYGAKIDKDNEMAKLVSEGNIRVSEMKEKQDIIMMVFSTPEKEEYFSYVVDCENKTVGEVFGEGTDHLMKGRFSGFFNWKKN